MRYWGAGTKQLSTRLSFCTLGSAAVETAVDSTSRRDSSTVLRREKSRNPSSILSSDSTSRPRLCLSTHLDFTSRRVDSSRLSRLSSTECFTRRGVAVATSSDERAVIPSASLPPYTGASVRLGTRALLFSLRENRCPWLRRVWSVSASRPTPPPGRCHFARAGASSLGAHAARAFLSPCPKASHPTSPSRVHSSITTSAPTHVWEEEPHRRVVEGASAAKSVCLAPSNRRGNALAVGHILMLLPRARGPRRCSVRVRGGAG